MSEEKPDFRERFPLTWMFHRNTSRWTFNTLAPSIEDTPEPPRELLNVPFLALPVPDSLNISLLESIHRRHSCRQFTNSPIPIKTLSTILKYAYGVIGESSFGPLAFLERPIPSGGSMYPLDLFIIANRVDGLDAGIYRYAPVTHGLEMVRGGVMPARLLTYLCMGQTYAADASILLIIGTTFLRSMKKYGDRGYRYILLEAGHVAQNINLLSTSVGLGNCNIGGFYDVELATLLRMEIKEEAPLYVIAIGPSRHMNREDSRLSE